jgi:hypothetical protein
MKITSTARLLLILMTVVGLCTTGAREFRTNHNVFKNYFIWAEFAFMYRCM